LGAAATDSGTEETIALAVKANERTAPKKDWAVYQAFVASNKNKPPKTKFGRLSFYHGWNSTHDSTICAVISNDQKYTANQKAYTEIPPGLPLDHDQREKKERCFFTLFFSYTRVLFDKCIYKSRSRL
jgi:hypothetical protein